MLTLPHPAACRALRRASWLAPRLAALGLLAVALTGCQGIVDAGATSQVRVIDVSPDAPALDIVPTSPTQPAPALYNVGFGAVSSYMQLAPGSYTHSAYVAGTQQQIAQVHSSFAPGAQYTVLAGNIAAGLEMTVLRDQSFAAPPGLVSLRFLGQSTRSAAIDLYLVPAGASLAAGLAPAAAKHSFGSNTGYRNLPAGAYSLVALPAGASPADATPLFTGSQTAYPAGSARTILLVDSSAAGASADADSPATAAQQIITAADYDAPA